jgi:hypothetical protein
MKTALLSVILLTGCAAAPQTMPTSPATYTQPVSQYNDCIEVLAAFLAFSRVGTGVLDKCFAGNGTQCDAFILFRDGMGDKLKPAEGIECVKNGTISPFHPLVASINKETPVFVKKMKKFDAMKRR